jgi:hypothetical protein
MRKIVFSVRSLASFITIRFCFVSFSLFLYDCTFFITAFISISLWLCFRLARSYLDVTRIIIHWARVIREVLHDRFDISLVLFIIIIIIIIIIIAVFTVMYVMISA